jgi:hypothetical protein
VQHPVADEREVRQPVSERDQLPVENAPDREAGKLWNQRCHVPAASGAHAEVAVAADDRPEAVPFDLKA